MGDDDKKRELQDVLRELTTHAYGVQGDRLLTKLTPDLIDLCHIMPNDSPRRIREKVSWMLEQLTQRLGNPSNQAIARHSFNITGRREVNQIKTLGLRQKALADEGGPKVRTSQDEITKTILPQFAENLLTDPPGPMPVPEQPAEPAAAIEPPQAEPTVAVQREAQSTPPPSRPNVDEQGIKARKRKKAVLIGGIAGGIALVAAVVVPLSLGGEDNPRPENNAETGNSQMQTPTTDDTSTAASNDLPQLVFDDLEGGEPTVRVFKGPTEESAEAIGVYNDGDSVPAVCKIKGRHVYSVPAEGEKERDSEWWIQIRSSSGEKQYATAVYVENPDALLAQLPDC